MPMGSGRKKGISMGEWMGAWSMYPKLKTALEYHVIIAEIVINLNINDVSVSMTSPKPIIG